ncbi:alpha/beta hydrolase [Winogradskyella litorisediminis]|uniref:Alpha/beta hydrolase n=1 Tax=Winogradskyella litorisediminis TaxID=1156618 RepID=A0ABW3NA95_9FLAO
MKKLFKIIIIVLGCVSFNSCQSKKAKSITESQFFTDSIYSENLSEYRKHNVYLPQNFDKNLKYPIIYETDGGIISDSNSYKIALDSLIANEIIKPVIIVESHSNTKIADSTIMKAGDGSPVNLMFRNFEYVNDYSDLTKNPLLANRYQNHMHYFKDELINKIEDKYNQKLKKADRYFYGYSNGAGFGLSLLNSYPEVIGTYLCFSTFGGNAQSKKWNKTANYPDLYLKYGSKEPFFLEDEAEFLKEKFNEFNQFIDVERFEGGHDNKIWKKEYVKTLAKILKND